MKHFTKPNTSPRNLHGKVGIQISNTVFTSKEKNQQFSSQKNLLQQNSPPSKVHDMEFYRNCLIEYSLVGIVKPKFTRRNDV